MNSPNPVSSSNNGSLTASPPGVPNVPPNLNSEKAKAALLIQSVYRGYSARKKLAESSFNRLMLELNAETGILSKKLIQVSERAEDSWRRQIISNHTQNQVADDLSLMANVLDILKMELELKKYTSHPASKTEVDEFKELCRKRLSSYQEQLKGVCERVGFKSVHKGISLIHGPQWKEHFSAEALELISAFNLLFTPTGYKLCHLQPVFGEPIGDLIDDAGTKERQAVRPLEKGTPFFRGFRFFTPSCAIDYIHGAELNIPIKLPNGEYQVLVMKGYFKNDPANISEQLELIRIKHRMVQTEFNRIDTVPKAFREAYLKQYSLRDLMLKTSAQAAEEMEADWKFISKAESRILPSFINEFKDASFERQLRIFTLLALQEEPRQALFLYEMVLKEVPLYVEALRNTMHYSLWRKLETAIDDLDQTKEKLRALKGDKIPYETRIAMSKLGDAAKQKALEKLKAMKSGSSESEKAEKYLNGLLKVPFGNYTPMPVNSQSSREEIQKYLNKVSQDLNDSVHGHDKAKEAILDWIAMRISNNEAKGECLAIEGPPGNGKTTLAKEGIAKALQRPFAFISMGGQTDSSYLIGHGFTYVGSDWGRIVEILRETQCMDPVIYIDEVDKISQTDKGRELIGVLTALTDFTQNKDFQDKYFSGIPFDLSKALFIFSYNDRSKLDRVFMDRLKVIRTEALSQQDKLAITRKHLLPEILKACGFKEGDVTIDDAEIKYLIDNYTIEAGARKLKENLFAIVRGLNRKRLTDPDTVRLPYHIDKDTIIRFREEPKIEFNKVADRPLVGMVNGLYATDIGIGGLLNIQVDKAPANERMSLTLTGSLKKVIKESMIVARSVAWNLIPDAVREKIFKEKPEGLHIHAPEGATPKDGPSAGGAITTAIISQLTGIPVRNDVAMTGEIDLIGRITKIGGLSAKLHGAKRAGAKLVLAPKENEKDLIKIKEKYSELIDDGFKVVLVESIHDVLDHALVHNPIARTPGFAACALKPPSDTVE